MGSQSFESKGLRNQGITLQPQGLMKPCAVQATGQLDSSYGSTGFANVYSPAMLWNVNATTMMGKGAMVAPQLARTKFPKSIPPIPKNTSDA
jgi:hypothetical protein